MNSPLITTPTEAYLPSIDLMQSTGASVVDRPPNFADSLRNVTPSTGSDRLAAAREAAAQFVGIAFVQPLLAQMRESPFATGVFAPTEAERRFGPVMDAALSDRITGATRWPLIDVLAERLAGPEERQEVDIHA